MSKFWQLCSEVQRESKSDSGVSSYHNWTTVYLLHFGIACNYATSYVCKPTGVSSIHVQPGLLVHVLINPQVLFSMTG